MSVGQSYFFWLNLGQPLAESIAVRDTVLPTPNVPTGARLKVVVFGFAGELELTRGATCA